MARRCDRAPHPLDYLGDLPNYAGRLRMARFGMAVEVTPQERRIRLNAKPEMRVNDMKTKMKTRIVMGVVSVLLAGVITSAAQAAEHEVKMLNKGTDGMMVFEPSIVKIAPGDTVHFVATDKGHNVMSIEGMMPGEASPFQGKMSQDLTVTFEKTGIYGVECKPHYGMGMVGLVVVGEPQNVAEAKSVVQKGKAKQHFEKLFQQLGL
jgi:pseudoazurin